MKKCIYSVLAICVISGYSCAQTAARSFADRGAGVYVSVTGNITYYNLPPTPVVASAAGTETKRTLQSGVVTPADVGAFRLFTGGPNFVLGGKNNLGQGIVEHYARADRESDYALQSSSAFPGVDIAGVLFDSKNDKLYILDAISLSILRGSWDGAQSISTVSLQSWATLSDTLELLNASSKMLEGTADKRVALTPTRWAFAESVDDLVVLSDKVGGGIDVELVGLPSVKVVPDRASMREGGTTVVALGLAGTNVQVVDVTAASAVIGSGTIGVGQDSVTINVSPALVMGHRYLVRETGDPTSGSAVLSVECIRREGFSEVLESGVALSPIYVGEDNQPEGQFIAHATVVRDTTISGHTVYPAIFSLAVGTVDRIVDPVLPWGANKILNPAVSVLIPTLAVVPPDMPFGSVHYGFEVANDPALVGLVALVQFGVDVSGNLRLSEIGGALMMAGPCVPGIPATSTRGVRAGRAFSVSPPRYPDPGRLRRMLARRRR